MTTAAQPEIVLGTMDFGTVVEQERAFAVLDRFLERGGRWLDTANCYSFWNDPSGLGGASERVLGEWLRRLGSRDAVLLSTKVRHDPLVPHSWPESAEGLSRTAIHRAVAGCLERLGTDYVDLLWAHAEDRSVPLEETVAAFGEVEASGAARRLGAANHAAWRVERGRAVARELGVAGWEGIQLRHSLVQPRPEASLPDAGHKLLTPDDLDLARSEALDAWAYTPLLNGGYVRADKPLPEAYAHPGTARMLAVLDDVAAKHGATRNHVVIAWLRAQGISPLIGMSRVEHVDEAMDALPLELDEDDMTRFAEAR